MSWHVDPGVVHRYEEGTLDRVAAASVEAHVTACEECRGLVAADRDWLDRSWAGVAGRVEPSRPGVVERVLTTVGVPAHVARIVAVSPALRLSFVFAVALVMAFSVAASMSNPEGGSHRLFLVTAPIVPVVGVAFAYGRLVDAAHEVTMASPIDAFRLLLLRAATVLAVSIVAGLAAWPVVPAPAGLGFTAWLMPAMALTLATLALSSRFEVWVSGAVVAGGWVVVMLLAVTRGYEMFDAVAQLGHVLVGLGAAAAVLTSRDRYDREGISR